MTIQETAAMLAILMAKWPNYPIPNPEATAAAYQMALADVPYDAAMIAAGRLMQQGKFFPVACEIRELAVTAVTALPSAEEAWREILGALRNGGLYAVHEWSTEPLRRTVETIGWRTICLSQEGDGDMADRFRRTYETYRRRAIHEADIAALWSGHGATAAIGVKA